MNSFGEVEPESPKPLTPVSQVPVIPSSLTSLKPVFIGTADKIGEGTYKTVYSCGITNADKAFFELPKDTDETNLCIAIVDIIKIIQEKYINDKN